MKTNNYLFVSAIAGAFFSLGSCSDYESAESADPRQNTSDLQKDVVFNPDDESLNTANTSAHKEGFLYVAGNDNGTNLIYVYRQPSGGDLTFAAKVSSGGSGNGQMIPSHGSIGIDRRNRILYALNAGDNTVSSFEVMSDGIPKLLTTVPTHGVIPVSIAIGDGRIYIVHSSSGSISGFRTDGMGNMVFIDGSSRKLSSAGAGPAQIALSPSGNYLFVTESITDKISAWRLSSTGRPGSRMTIPVTGKTPGGIDFSHNRFMTIPNGELGLGGSSSVTSYSGIGNGHVNAINGAVGSHQTGSTAIKTTSNGFYSYVVNNGSDNISSFYTRTDGLISLAEPSMQTGDGPAGITIASNNFSVYVMCQNENSIHSYLRVKGGGLIQTAKTLNHARFASGIVAW